jgi:hypothetical protein
MKLQFERLMVRASIGLVLITAIGTAGTMDLDTAINIETAYAERVCDGVHRDYENQGVRCEY